MLKNSNKINMLLSKWFKVLYLIIILFVIYFIPSPNIEMGEKAELIIEKVDSLDLIIGDVIEQNNRVLSVLFEWFSADNSYLVSKESIINQVRMFYAGFLAALISLLITIKEKENKIYIWLLLIFLIPIMYFLEIHQNDLLERSETSAKIKKNAIEILANNTSQYYKLDSCPYIKELRKMEYESKIRKLKKIINPSFELMIFYIVPFFIIYFLPIKYKSQKFEVKNA